ncbi:hypothetical protein KOR42_45390 [Thalassoglobus neptunius]|uniref:3-keto-alpha-glucoside-1,2-lyase/3-keto-2-hydroxy-glucal hydratase domain-containing protein n=1 Tax=Thalassoglobus neptunius TaxID=1938619 RepID=A0A5C5VZ20_9PLAN|nr:DUF1080 domain-containing protein [Thalassoglobus neptunius]TWT43009.1 hypothetical protein KOR42_45390 [Thalassoglobus neptunius]
MTRFVFSLALLFSIGSQCTAGEWQTLFNGKSLEGWTQKNGWASYAVEDGAIVGRTAPASPNSFLCTLDDYGDFELEFEVKVDNGLNSGVQIRSKTKDVADGNGKNNQVGRVYGPQVEIESGPAEAGYVYGEATGRGWLTPEDRLKPHDHFKNEDWNQFRIAAKGPRIQTFINGQEIEDLTDEPIFETHPSGFIGLQVHGIGNRDQSYEVRWRNIRIKELD